MTSDAVIVGGGPAGATAGLLLARAGWSVVVIEKTAFPRQKVCGEYLSAANVPIWRELGVDKQIASRAGPEIREVGLFTREDVITAPLPQPRDCGWGRALGREHLDSLLLEEVKRAGATVLQPCNTLKITQGHHGFVCEAVQNQGEIATSTLQLRTPIVIAAHGSWFRGSLPTQSSSKTPRPHDLFGFKAHFRNSPLPVALMPALVFPGGYGGMVHTDGGRVSVSCCIRRDALQRIRRLDAHLPAAEALLLHIVRGCRGLEEALRGAKLDEAWLSVGPIRPGFRRAFQDGIFCVGNAAGEAHPIIAEGITMAVQSAWLLARVLIRNGARDKPDISALGSDYATLWRKSFKTRIRVAGGLVRITRTPVVMGALLPILRRSPSLLTAIAALSGKANLGVFKAASAIA